MSNEHIKSIIIDEEVHKAVKIHASKEGKSIREVVERFLNAQLEQHPNGGAYAREAVPDKEREGLQGNI